MTASRPALVRAISARSRWFGKIGNIDERLIFGVVVLLAFCLQFWIVWSVNFPPLHDAPNHMARHFLEEQHFFGRKESEFYEVKYKVLPNLGADLVIPFLMAIFSPVVSLKIFISCALVVYWFGPALFIWHHGNYSRASMAASLLLLPLNMSESFFWGFLNFYSGFGLAFLALVHFEKLVERRSPVWLHVIMHVALVTLLFFWHLAALAIYAVIMASRVATLLWSEYVERGLDVRALLSRAFLLSAPILPSLILYKIWSATKGVSENYWGTWPEKLGLPLHLFRTYSFAADGFVCVLWILACYAFFIWRWRSELKSWLWLPSIAFTALMLLIPIQWGSTFHGDARFPPALLVCLLAISSGLSLRSFAVGATIVAMALLVRYGSVYVAWSKLDMQLTAVSKGLEALPEGSRIMTVTGPNAGYVVRRDWPLSDFSSWAVPLRNAFDPTIYAYPDQQPLSIKRDARVYAKFDGRKIVVADEPTRSSYDFVYIYNPFGWQVEISSHFEKIFERGDVSIWRVDDGTKEKG